MPSAVLKEQVSGRLQIWWHSLSPGQFWLRGASGIAEGKLLRILSCCAAERTHWVHLDHRNATCWYCVRQGKPRAE